MAGDQMGGQHFPMPGWAVAVIFAAMLAALGMVVSTLLKTSSGTKKAGKERKNKKAKKGK